jgi:hypothetical protein
MLVMPSNNSNAHKLEQMYPGRMGLLIGPSGWRDPRGLPYALDNGRFAVWAKGQQWSADDFIALLDKAAACDTAPLWVVVPDVVGAAMETFGMWRTWVNQLRDYGWPLALAVQDGMTIESVREYTNPDVIFVGGSTLWKRNTLWAWCQEWSRVHVGRVNTEK